MVYEKVARIEKTACKLLAIEWLYLTLTLTFETLTLDNQH